MTDKDADVIGNTTKNAEVIDNRKMWTPDTENRIAENAVKSLRFR